MYPILIAQDYNKQHLPLLAELESSELEYQTCRNTELDITVHLIKSEPDILICNASKLGFDAIQRLCSKSQRRLLPQCIVNIYTYEDPQELEMLCELGIKENLSFPYDPKALVEYIRDLREARPCDLNDLVSKIAGMLDAYMLDLNKSEKQRGNVYIRDAVLILLFEHNFKVNLHGDIYERIAKKYSTSVKSVEHSIRISIESCWKHGNKDKLKALMGSSFVDCKRPTNFSFIMSLARVVLRDNKDNFDLYMLQIMNNTSFELHI